MQWLNNNSNALMVIITSVYVFFTLLLVIPTFKSNKLLRKSLEQSEKFEQARIRPILHLDILIEYPPEENSLPVGYLLLKNTGLTQAFDISINMEPEMYRIVLIGGSGETKITPYFIKNKVANLAPTSELSDNLGFLPNIYEEFDNPIFNFEIHYKDIYGTQYQEKGCLDFNIMRDAIPYNPPHHKVIVHNEYYPPVEKSLISTLKRKIINLIEDFNP